MQSEGSSYGYNYGYGAFPAASYSAPFPPAPVGYRALRGYSSSTTAAPLVPSISEFQAPNPISRPLSGACSFYSESSATQSTRRPKRPRQEEDDEEIDGPGSEPSPEVAPSSLSGIGTAQTSLFRPIDFEGATSSFGDAVQGANRSALDVSRSAQTSHYQLPTPPQSERGVSPPDSLPAASPVPPPSSHGVTVSLSNEKVWESFAAVGNEMIVTKLGRRLFPTVLIHISGLQRKTSYSVSLRVASSDSYRYKYLNCEWKAVGESEVIQDEKKMTVEHSNSPRHGSFWTNKPVSFKSVKITHSPNSKHGDILLHTMHKYHIEIVIAAVNSEETPIVVPLPNTTFIAVTAYQNSLLTDLKIDNNPFAKGFRDKRSTFDSPDSTTVPLPSSPYTRGKRLWELPIPPLPLPTAPPMPSSAMYSAYSTPGACAPTAAGLKSPVPYGYSPFSPGYQPLTGSLLPPYPTPWTFPHPTSTSYPGSSHTDSSLHLSH